MGPKFLHAPLAKIPFVTMQKQQWRDW